MTLSTLASLCWPHSVGLALLASLSWPWSGVGHRGRLHAPGATRLPKRGARYEPLVRWEEQRNLQRLFRQFAVSGKSAESQFIGIAGN